ncbi:MAG: F0F1 ATP synthase subunit alpha, partial [Rubrobacter sp.]|nr:F0F1 ATP synthase subunit alpha [Rubrobacter sp.]
LLKQRERDPMPVEEQVAVIFGGTQGLLRDVDPDDVPDWEAQLREYLRSSHEDLLKDIREKKELTDETADKLRKAIEHFNEGFEPARSEVRVETRPQEEKEEG